MKRRVVTIVLASFAVGAGLAVVPFVAFPHRYVLIPVVPGIWTVMLIEGEAWTPSFAVAFANGAWYAVTITAIYLFFALMIRAHQRAIRNSPKYRREHNLCIHCAYNLTGNTSGVCPECGTKIESRTMTETLHVNPER